MTELDYTNMTPENVRKAADLAAEAVRYMNHATFPGRTAALRDPADVDAVLVALDALGERLPQLLDQLGAWEAAEAAAGRLRVAYGKYAQSPSTEAVAVSALRQYLTEASARIKEAWDAMHDARQISAALAPAPEPRPTLRAPEPREGE